MQDSVKQRHFVQEIRTALGWTQKELAKRLGVSTITVRRIESGGLKVSRSFAMRFFCETGFSGGFEAATGRPVVILVPAVKKLPYTRKDYLDWKARWSNSTEEDRKTLAESLHAWIEILFEAAHDSKVSFDLFAPVYQAVVDALNQACQEFRLVEKADKIVKKRWPNYGSDPRWNAAMLAPQIKNNSPGSFNLTDLLRAVSVMTQKESKKLPSPPYPENAHRADGRKSSSRARRRPGVPTSVKP